jgi:hypothetical protein
MQTDTVSQTDSGERVEQFVTKSTRYSVVPLPADKTELKWPTSSNSFWTHPSRPFVTNWLDLYEASESPLSRVRPVGAVWVRSLPGVLPELK